MTTFLWVIFPYMCLTTFVVGHYWRYHYDKFGWTTRSSQLYEDRLLRIGSPLFHFGMLGVVGGHLIGLVLPQGWTDAIGLSRHTYHVIALAAGIPAGVAAVVGLLILIYRRRMTGPVFSATTTNDKAMYAVLGAVIILGIWNTVAGSLLQFGGEYNYREGVSVWFRSIFAFQPQPENVEFLKRELFHGAFERRLTFNVPVNADGIEATYEMGVLTLRVPKAEAIKPKQIKVQAK